MDKITVSNLHPLTKENMWQAVEEIRELGFGVTIGTYSHSLFKVLLIYWPNPDLIIEGCVDKLPEIAMTKALVLARQIIELEELLLSDPPA